MSEAFSLVVRGGTIVLPDGPARADVGVRDGTIAAVGELADAQAEAVFDARGLHVLPGPIDEHVHSRDPGLTYKEDFEHATRAAAAGGITTILEMPNSVPPVIDAGSFRARADHLAGSAHVDYGLWAMVLGDRNSADLAGLADAGAVGFKLFWGYELDRETLSIVYRPGSDEQSLPPPSDAEIFDAFRAIAATGRPVGIHAEHAQIIERLTAREQAAGTDYVAYLRSRPPFTEALVVETAIRFAEATGARLHVLHVAAEEAVALIAAARRRGLRVTGEACAHHLALGPEDFDRVGPLLKTCTPVREERHRARLWRALAEGDLETVASDHAPHHESEKVGDVWSVLPGVPGVQTLLPVMLDAVAEGRLELTRLAEVISARPARLFGLARKGAIAVGADADLCLVDLSGQVTIAEDEMLSKNRSTPFAGMTFRGRPVASFLRGRQIMADGRPLGPRTGTLVTP